MTARPARSLMAVLLATAALATSAGAGERAVVAVSPVLIGSGVDLSRQAAAPIDTLVVRQLREIGYDVVPAREVRALQRELSDALGGAFDQRTGLPVGDRPDTLGARLRRELAARHGAAAWLRPALREVVVRFSGDRVRWEGIDESTGGTGGTSGLLFGRTEGSLPVLAVYVVLDDLRADSLHLGRSGIRLARRVVRNKPVRVPAESLLADPVRNEAAVRRVMDATIGAYRTAAGGR